MIKKICVVAALASSPIYAVEADSLEEIKVLAHPLSERSQAQSVSVLKGEELERKVAGSLGDTLSGEPGIQSSSFGVAVGRPVIHGLGGPRVKTTEDRIDSLDVSVTSSDHAVTIEPFIANQVTVLKGASTLLYGSGSIGGVVDVETGRIPKQLPESSMEGKAELRYSDNGDATTAVLRLDGKTSDNFAWHLDAFDRNSDNYDIPGFVESENQRLSEAEEEGEEHEEEEGHEDEHGHEEGEEERDILEGSELENRGGAFGFSFVGDDGGYAGLSVSTLDATYGLVGGHGHEEEGEHHDDEGEGHDEEEEHHDEDEEHHEEDEEGTGILKMKQTRVDFDSKFIDPFRGIDELTVRLGINDYEHQEIEANGEIGTRFDNDAWEGRIEFAHHLADNLKGVFGLQFGNREFSAIGEEAFVAPVKTDNAGIFWVGEKSFDAYDIEAGIRFDSVDHQPSGADLVDTDFSTISASLGIVYPVNDVLSFSGLIDYSERAPSIEELYSNGPHLATQSFEIGNLNLQEEAALAFTGTATMQSELYDFSVSIYRMGFDDYIYQAGTGEIRDEFPVLVYRQDDATFTGFDAKANIHLGTLAQGDIDMSFLADVVRAKLDTSANINRNLPRIPASRVGVGLHWKNENWDLDIDWLEVSSQNDIADFELATRGYSDLSFSIKRNFSFDGMELSAFLRGKNLTDDEQRHHTSIVKDFAPAPGRRFEVGVRLKF